MLVRNTYVHRLVYPGELINETNAILLGTFLDPDNLLSFSKSRGAGKQINDLARELHLKSKSIDELITVRLYNDRIRGVFPPGEIGILVKIVKILNEPVPEPEPDEP